MDEVFTHISQRHCQRLPAVVGTEALVRGPALKFIEAAPTDGGTKAPQFARTSHAIIFTMLIFEENALAAGAFSRPRLVSIHLWCIRWGAPWLQR